ncbi:hypothetical protein Tco_1083590, partial [Tanacetum coccineum]
DLFTTKHKQLDDGGGGRSTALLQIRKREDCSGGSGTGCGLGCGGGVPGGWAVA